MSTYIEDSWEGSPGSSEVRAQQLDNPMQTDIKWECLPLPVNLSFLLSPGCTLDQCGGEEH